MTRALAVVVIARQNAGVQNHSKAIIEALQTLPSWVDFDPDPNKWTREQVAERMPVWSILPRYWKQGTLPSPKERLWLAICNGTLVGWDDRSHTTVGPSARGSLDLRSLAEHGVRPATVLPPQPVLEEFRRSPWNTYPSDTEVTVLRNEWIERAAAASAVRERVRPLIYEASRLVVQSGMDPAPLDELMKSTYMQDEVIDRAVAVLRKVAPQPHKHPRRPEDPSAIEGPGPEAAAPKRTPRIPHGDNGRRPKRDAIDSVARQLLKAALEAAAENGTPYIPERKAIARAVSTQLEFRIGVASLFGTEQRGDKRVHRYPGFIELWQQTNKHSADASRHARTSRKAKASHRRRAVDS